MSRADTLVPLSGEVRQGLMENQTWKEGSATEIGHSKWFKKEKGDKKPTPQTNLPEQWRKRTDHQATASKRERQNDPEAEAVTYWEYCPEWKDHTVETNWERYEYDTVEQQLETGKARYRTLTFEWSLWVLLMLAKAGNETLSHLAGLTEFDDKKKALNKIYR